MSFPRYPKYKPSGVEWLGEVPEGWEVKRLKHNARLLTQKTDRRDHPVGLENIEGWSGRFLPTETAFEGEGIAFDAGDILFGKLRPYLAKAYLAKSSGEAVGDFHVIRPAVGMEGRFVTMYLDYAEDQAERSIPMTMQDWATKLNAFLQFNERDLLDHPGKVSQAVAKAFAESEFEKYRFVQDRLFESDFDRLLKQLPQQGGQL